MLTPLRVLIVEDVEDDAQLVIRILKKGGYDPEYLRVETAAAMQDALREKQWDVILCDYTMPNLSVPVAITLLMETDLDIPLIIVSGSIGEEAAVECMRLGARDYIRKENLSLLIPAINRELAEAKIRNSLKQVERQWRKSWENYRLLAEATSDFILTTDQNLIITFANKSLRNLLGDVEPVGLNIVDFVPPKLHEKQQEMVKRRYEGYSEVLSYEWEAIDPKGNLLIIDVTSQPLKEDGKFVGLLFSARDITGRKQSEEAMKRLIERLDLALHAANLGVWDWDIQNNQMLWDDRMHELYGVQKGDFAVSYDAWINRLHPDDVAYSHEEFKKALSNEKDYNTEFRYTLSDGSVRNLRSYGKVIRDVSGEPLRMTGINYDITERKKMEAQLLQAQKMEAIGQLAGGVAHDLNNVLGVLSGYSELLRDEIPEGQLARSHIEKILQSTEKAAAIIQDLLTLARRGVVVSDVINLNKVVSDFIKTPVFEKMKDYHPSVIFRTECQEELLNIKGSGVHLEKTLVNLVSNAAESISGQGVVTIRTESCYLDAPIKGYDEIKEGDYAIVAVSDTGTGILPENKEKIFEPFYTKKTMGRSGTGLGLSIVWGTVKDHQGYIDVQTKVGEGTTFTLYFPVTRKELTMQQQKVPKEQYMGKGESVLVVDDIAEQRDVATGLLKKLGYEVHTVSGGEEAVEYLKRDRADILVLDMIMAPGIDGLETYKRVLELNPKQKAILVSGFSETDRVRKAQKLGAGAYVKKPYIMEKIGLAIRDELNR
jgi:PAS domain S-box-containing protein